MIVFLELVSALELIMICGVGDARVGAEGRQSGQIISGAREFG